MTRRLVALLALALLGGCGSSGAASKGDADPARAVPASAALYFELVVRPEGTQRETVKALAAKILRTPDPGAKIVSLLDRALHDNDAGSSYRRDIEPWLGRRAGVYLADLAGDRVKGVGVIDVRDRSAAAKVITADVQRRHARSAGYRDVKIYTDPSDHSVVALAGDYALFADAAADLHPVIDTLKGAPALAASDRYTNALSGLPDDRVGTLFVDVRQLLRSAIAGATKADPSGGAMLQSLTAGNAAAVGAALLADKDRLSIEVRTRAPKRSAAQNLSSLFSGGGAGSLVREAPAGSWAVLGTADLGKTAKGIFDAAVGGLGGAFLNGSLQSELGIDLDKDVFGWIGDTSVFVRGGDLAHLDGAVVMQVTDEAAARQAVPKLVGLARQRGGVAVQPVKVRGADLAFAGRIEGAPAPAVVALGHGRAVVALGTAAAADGLSPDRTIDDSGLYDRAKSAADGLDPGLILDGPSVVRLIAAGAGGDPDFAKAKPYLDLIDLLAFGAGVDGDDVRARMAVTLR